MLFYRRQFKAREPPVPDFETETIQNSEDNRSEKL